MHNFWGVMLRRCVIHSRIFESSRIFHTARSHSSKNKTKKEVTKLKTRALRMQFVFTFSFAGHILVTLYWHIFVGINFSSIIFLNYDLMRSENYYFLLPLLSFFCSSWHCFRSVPLNVVTYGTRVIWRLVFKLSSLWISLQRQTNLTNLKKRNKLT